MRRKPNQDIHFNFLFFLDSAAVEGGYSIQYRENVIKTLNAYEDQEIISGYFLDGFHINGDTASKIDKTKVCDIVEKCNHLLPSNKLKVMFGAYTPEMILRLVQLGIDIFDTTYAYLAASNNRALTFNFNVDNAATTQKSIFEINLADEL